MVFSLHALHDLRKFCGLFLFTFFCTFKSWGQTDSTLILNFDFNAHTFNESHNLVQTKPVGVSLVEDRFGNEKSAVFINGHLNSYLSLGTSKLLKSGKTTISFWVNLNMFIYAGRGNLFNPVFLVKNGPGDDFYIAYCIAFSNNRFTATSTKDSIKEAIVNSVNHVDLNKWYHLVLTSDASNFSFYVNGNLQGHCKKDFETTFLSTDSVILGHSANSKNERYSQGVFDDIRIYHRVLGEKEIKELYQAPDPNKSHYIFLLILKGLGIAAGIFVVAFLLVWQRRTVLKRAKEKFDLTRKLHETEIRTLKAQMNPHFIFNSLNSINQFIMTRENDKAEQYLAIFSKLIRELLESNLNESLTVKEEIDILSGYLEMESLRFDASFSFSITVDEKINPARTHISHMMIQPFVENAIWHGLLPKASDRLLQINFYPHSKKTIQCVIEDNGIGRKNSHSKESTFKKKSLALSFVQQRLDLMNNNLGLNCSVVIIDKENSAGESLGTLVKIILPILNNS